MAYTPEIRCLLYANGVLASSSQFHQIISITSPNTHVASLGILSGSPLGSLSSIFSYLQPAPSPFLKKKSRSRPNRVASLGILSGSLPGSSCLSVPVGASLYSFVEPLQFSISFYSLTPLPIHNSRLSIPWRSPYRFPSPLPFPSPSSLRPTQRTPNVV